MEASHLCAMFFLTILIPTAFSRHRPEDRYMGGGPVLSERHDEPLDLPAFEQQDVPLGRMPDDDDYNGDNSVLPNSESGSEDYEDSRVEPSAPEVEPEGDVIRQELPRKFNGDQNFQEEDFTFENDGDDDGDEEDDEEAFDVPYHGGFIFDAPFFNIHQITRHFKQLERAMEHVFRQALQEASLVNGTFANTTEEEVVIGGRKYRVQKSVIRMGEGGGNSSLFIEAISSVPEGVKNRTKVKRSNWMAENND